MGSGRKVVVSLLVSPLISGQAHERLLGGSIQEKIADSVESGMAKSETVWVNLIATRCTSNFKKGRAAQ